MLKIELIAYSSNLISSEKRDLFISIINNSKADVILFPGSTLNSSSDLAYALGNITNNYSIIVFEVGDLKEITKSKKEKKRNSIYSGLAYVLDLSKACKQLPDSFRQVFSTSDELSASPELMDALWNQFNNGLRRFMCKGKRFTVLMCGETAVLKCDKSAGKLKNAGFRFQSESKYNVQFQGIESHTDIYLNPIHTIQREQGIMAKKRERISAREKYYFSTASLANGKNLKTKSLQYAYFDSIDFTFSVPSKIVEGRYVSSVFYVQ